jgi:type VI secretion system ImpC/EvpB family protein
VLTREAPAPAPAAAGPAPLDLVLAATPDGRTRGLSLLDQFLGEPDPVRALRLWVPDLEALRGPDLRRRVVRRLNEDVARIDGLLNGQVNAVMHHPAFQRLEASWRGLHYLVDQVPEGANIKVRALSLSWKELTRDLERAIEFDQSQLFRKVYNDEFGMPGGEPFGVLLGDYEVRHRPAPDHPYDDVTTLGGVAAVAAAAFAPFVAAAHPTFFDLTGYSELELPLNLARTFEQLEYLKWKALRDREDARFVGLALPRVLLRLPFRDDTGRADNFRFREEVEAPDRSGYLWGNAAYAFGGVLIRAFAESGWLAGIRGARRGTEGEGLVTGLPVHASATSRADVAPKCPTDATVTDAQEKELGELGFIPLCACQDTGMAAFHGNQSVQKPKVYDEPAATANARLSAMLQYILCVSRFAHYIKVISRDKIGAFTGPADCEDYLRKWLANYITASDTGGLENKAKYPLREARVRVREQPDRPGSFLCEIHLRPHFQLDRLVAPVRLVTELAPAQPG